MATSSDQPIEIAPFHAGGSLRGFVVCGRWPDSTKEWMQLLIVTVRIATLPGLLSTTTIFGAREDLPDDPAPGMVGLVIAEGTVLGESAVAPGRFAEHQPCGAAHAPPSVGNQSDTAGMPRRGVRLPPPTRNTASGLGPSGRLGGGRVGRHGHFGGEPGRYRSHQRPGHGSIGNAACRIAVLRSRATMRRGTHTAPWSVGSTRTGSASNYHITSSRVCR